MYIGVKASSCVSFQVFKIAERVHGVYHVELKHLPQSSRFP